MADELQLVVKESGLEKSKVETLLASFGEYFQKAKLIAEQSQGILVTSEDQTKEMTAARVARLQLKEIRCEVENTRKELKEQSLREGKAIDGISNVIKTLIIPVEEHLEKQEKFAEIAEQKRKAERLAKRIELLSQYVEDITLYTLSDMSDEAFNKLLDDSRKALEAQKAAEKKAEEERIAREKLEAEEREKMRHENEKLKKEREEQEKKLADERRKAEAERQKQEEILRKEREAKEKLERELAEKKAAEEKAKREEEERITKEKAAAEEAERQKLLAPDKEKMRVIYTKIQQVINDIDLTRLSSPKTHKVAQETIEGLQNVMSKMSEGMRNL